MFEVSMRFIDTSQVR